jgi:guanine deaminase
VTPRFAPTSSPEQLERAGALLAEDPSLHMQTHLSENTAELAWVAELFPEARDYTDVYARFGLLGPRSIFAHGIHLSHREWGALRDSGSCIAHCPTSNLFLGSGLFDLTGAVQRHEVGVALASDVGGGTHLSPLRTMGAAYQVAQLRGDSVSAARLLWSHTAGAARALRLDDELGNLDVGQFGDAVVLRPEASALGRFRLRGVERPEERLFYALTTGDDRMVAETWVAGESAFVRDR